VDMQDATLPYKFDFDPRNRILRCWFEGRVTDQALREFYRAAIDYVALTDPLAGVLDFTAVSLFDVSPKTVRALANLPPAMPDAERPRVFIAASLPTFGFLRMFQIQGQHSRPNIHIVRTARQAWAILGVPDPRFEPIPTE